MRFEGKLLMVGSVVPDAPDVSGVVVELPRSLVRQLGRCLYQTVRIEAHPPLTRDCVEVLKAVRANWSSTAEVACRARHSDLSFGADVGNELEVLFSRGLVDRRRADPESDAQWRLPMGVGS